MESILITGCTKGLGHALATEYLSAGSRVFAVVRRSEPLESLIRNYSDRLHLIVGDITDPSVKASISSELERQHASLDVVINNAGFGGEGYSAQEVDLEFLDMIVQTNCTGALRVVQACIPYLSRSRSRIVNISSRLGSLKRNSERCYTGNFSYTYRIAKAAQNMLTICLSQDASLQGVVVCCFHPGRIKTDSAASDADLDAPSAARRLRLEIEKLKSEHNGRFLDAAGGDIPW